MFIKMKTLLPKVNRRQSFPIKSLVEGNLWAAIKDVQAKLKKIDLLPLVRLKGGHFILFFENLKFFATKSLNVRTLHLQKPLLRKMAAMVRNAQTVRVPSYVERGKSSYNFYSG